jgi:hypothetical protein
MTMMSFTAFGWSLSDEHVILNHAYRQIFFKRKEKRENHKWSRSKITLYHKKFTLHLFMKFGP